MKRKGIVLIALALSVVTPATAQNVGGGVSLWLPESAYLANDGSLGVETALGSSIGFGELLSAPFGLVYNQVYALMAERSDGVAARPWFYADTLMPFLMAKVRIPIAIAYVDAFGGLVGLWNMTVKPLTKNIEGDIAAAGRLFSFEDALTVDGGRFGWGWQVGGAVGVRIDSISVDLNVTYRLARADAMVGGTYSSVDVAGGTVTPGQSFSEAIRLRLAGFSIGIDASIEL